MKFYTDDAGVTFFRVSVKTGMAALDNVVVA
jgi:hypothetical protein